MNEFKVNNIISDYDEVAEKLKSARQVKKISLAKAALDLKINQKYLKALEEGDFDQLPSGVYKKNFLKEYLIYLKIYNKDLLKIFEQTSGEPAKRKNPFAKNRIKEHRLVIFPKIIKNLTIFLVVALCLSYLLLSLKKIIMPPILEVSNPGDNIILKENFVNIIGRSEPEAQVVINDEAVMIDANGVFTLQVALSQGINKIVIKAKKKHSRENVIIKQVLVD